MPEPNLPPLRLVDQDNRAENSNILNVNEYRINLPELPYITRNKLLEKYELSADHAYRLVEDPNLLEYFKKTVDIQLSTSKSEILTKYAKMASQMIFCDLENIRSKWPSLSLCEIYVKPKHIARAAQLRADRDLSANLIKRALDLIMDVDKYRNADIDDIIAEQGWLDCFRDMQRIEEMVTEAIKDHKKLVGKYIRGNTKGFDTIVRNIFKKHGSVIDPYLVREELKKQLEHMKQIHKQEN